jgi:hypothetical protein
VSGPLHDDVDADFGALLRDAALGVDAAIERDGGTPDFAAVVALANRIDAARVDAEAVADAAALAPVVPLRAGRRRGRTRDDPDLAAIVDEVRAHVDQCVAAGLSPAAPVVSVATRVRSRRVWAGVLAAAASLALVVLGVAKAAELFERGEVERHEAAQHEQVPAPQQQMRAPAIERTAPAPRADAPALEADAPAADEAAPAVEPDAPPSDKRERAKRKRAAAVPEATPAATPGPTLDEQLAALDREAHAAWRAGDRSTAQGKFRRIVELAGTRRIADLAYGDLFTLARQAGKGGAEAALWREYLTRFPSGRFADDARAGLCRRAAKGDARACWEDYLRDFPEGSFRGQAERGIAEPSQ